MSVNQLKVSGVSIFNFDSVAVLRESIASRGASREADLELFAIFDRREIMLVGPWDGLQISTGGRPDEKRWVADDDDSWPEEFDLINGVRTLRDVFKDPETRGFRRCQYEVPYYTTDLNSALKLASSYIDYDHNFRLEHRYYKQVGYWNVNLFNCIGESVAHMLTTNPASGVIICYIDYLMNVAG
jgi:hypothetical protein